MSYSPVRQTALNGPIDIATLWPAFLKMDGVPLGYVPVTQLISHVHPLIVTAAGGFGPTGALDRIGVSTANLTWPAVPVTDYFSFHLYVDVHADGTLTTGHTPLEPIYQEAGVPSTAAGQHTYNVLEAKMFVGDGHTAKQVWRVFLGYGWGSAEQGRITGFRLFGYLGRWTSAPWPFPLPGSSYRLDDTHLPGRLYRAEWRAICLANDGNYWPPSELPLSSFDGYFTEVIDIYTRVDAANVPPQILDDNGNRVAAHPDRWNLRCYLTRTW